MNDPFVYPFTYGNSSKGITLRDKYAGQAMAATISRAQTPSDAKKTDIAGFAYEMADAMLEARVKKED